MTVYFVTILLGVLLAALAGSRSLAGSKEKINHARRGTPAVMAFLVGLIFVSVAGLRYQIGTDYWTYEAQYYRIYSNFSWRNFKLDSEPAFSALATFSGFWYDDSASMFFLASLVTIGLMVKTYAKYSSMFAMSILLMMITGAWHGSLNGVRQYLAAAIILAGHYFIIERRFKIYFLIVMLASLFHISAWVCLLLYFVPRRSIKLSGALALVAGAMVAVGSYDFIAQVLTVVQNQDIASNSYFLRTINPLRVALAFAPYLIYLLFVNRSQASSVGHFYVNLTLIHGALYLVAISSAYLARFTIYTNLYLALAWPVLFTSLSRKNRIWLVPLVILLYAIYWYLEVAGTATLNPFKWIWNRNA